MNAYYNEIDPFCAQWLRNLMAANLIPAGEVDERSIADVSPDDLRGFGQCHFFAGIGGWAYAARLAGWPDDRELWTGSCPCQPFSVAGLGKGADDERHLWPHQFRLIRECRPASWYGEQVPGAVGKGWLDEVFNELESIDYACWAAVVPASAVGAKHKRERIWIAANAIGDKQPREESCGRADGRVGRQLEPISWDRDWQGALREFRAMDDGLSYGVAATDAARNAIVPQIAAEVMKAFMDARP